MSGALPGLAQALLCAVVLVAAAMDITTRRIPNWVTAPGAALGVALHGYYGGWQGALLSLAGAVVGLLFFLLLHAAGGMGAGDVKLAGAVGALVGPQSFVWVFIATGLLGGIAALGLAIAHGRLRQTLMRTAGLLAHVGRLRWNELQEASSLTAPDALRLPYGAVIAAGTLVWVLTR